MNELQAALFFGLLSIPFTCALGVRLARGIFLVVLVLAAVPVFVRRAMRATGRAILRAMRATARAILRAPGATYRWIDRCLQRLAPPTLEGFRIEYATLDYYLRTSPRALTLERQLQAIREGVL